MKSLLRIIRRYVFAAFFIIILILFLDIAAYIAMFFGLGDDIYGNRSNLITISEELTETDGQFSLSPEGESLLVSHYAWGMLLDVNGNAIWTWNLPEEIPASFTVPEAASFSRWYLHDYPVYVWQHDRGLLVLARPKGSFWKLNINRPQQLVEQLPAYGLLILTIDLLLIFSLAALAGGRLYKALRPIVNGIRDLEKKDQVHLPETGMLSELSVSLNKTSALLAEQAEKLAQRDHARAAWISGVSHDIRTPLSLIMGYARELEDLEDLPEASRASARIIKEQSLCIRQLIEDLNLTSKLEYQSCPLRITTFYPAALLRQTAADFMNQNPDGPWEIRVTCSPAFSSAQIDADAGLIARVFRNLIGNSIRHNPEGCSIRIIASLTQSGGQCSILFMDDGAGIPRRVLRVLEYDAGHPAETLWNTPASSLQNQNTSGENQSISQENQPHVMGLKIVQQIVKAHGGSVEFFPEYSTQTPSPDASAAGCRIAVLLPVS